jgi:maltokinase
VTVDQIVDRITGALAEWLPSQRWFAGKNRPVRAVRPHECTELVHGDPQLVHAVVEVHHTDGSSDRYQLLLGVRAELPDHLLHGLVGRAGGLTVYDAMHDHELATRLLELVATTTKVDRLAFTAAPDTELDPTLRARPVGAEQSNTSVVYGQRYILKIFRRLQPGLSPDLELHRALHEVGCEHIAAPLGWVSGELDGEPTTLALLSAYLPNAADGWAMATASVRDLLAEADLRADEVGGDFAGEAHRLGHAVATVHADLDRALGHREPDGDLLAGQARAMHERLAGMLRAVPELAAHQDGLRAAFDAAGALDTPMRLQRIHGDLHLGQVLRTPTHWVLIDFEGEPAAPLAGRREPGSPLRDVAGMLRSFDYAAYHMLLGQDGDRRPAVRAVEWSDRNRNAFCDGYAQVAGDPREHAVLLRALELDKAVYEVGYEAAHRPDWQAIPLASIERLLATP